MYIYIYTYICTIICIYRESMSLSDLGEGGRPTIRNQRELFEKIKARGQKRLHTRTTQVKLRSKIPPEIHWNVSVKSPGKVTILWTVPLTNESPLEAATGSPR